MQCKFTKPDGEQCNANAMRDADYCYLHNPDIPEAEKREAMSKGGQSKAITIAEPLQAVKIEDSQDVASLLAETINLVRAGKLDVKTANSIGFLSDKLIKAIETANLQGKVEFIERAILEKRTRY